MTGRVLGLIPARAGSKGIPGKNLKLLAGRPLIWYAADAARRSGQIDRLILSTDSEHIATVGRKIGVEVPFLRPAELAQDDTPMLSVIEHAVAALEHEGWTAEIVVLLQPTSPLRRPEHIERAVTILRQTGADSVVSVVRVRPDMSPDYVLKIVDGRLEPFLREGALITRRQDARPAYSRDGTVYAFWRETLAKHRSIYGIDCRPLEIPRDEAMTLDTQEDWEEAERLMSRAAAG